MMLWNVFVACHGMDDLGSLLTVEKFLGLVSVARKLHLLGVFHLKDKGRKNWKNSGRDQP